MKLIEAYTENNALVLIPFNNVDYFKVEVRQFSDMSSTFSRYMVVCVLKTGMTFHLNETPIIDEKDAITILKCTVAEYDDSI